MTGITDEEYQESLGENFKNSPTFWQLQDIADIHFPKAIEEFSK